MKKTNYLLIALFILISINTFARKGRGVSVGTVEELIHKHDLPDIEKYYLKEIVSVGGTPKKLKLYLDLGIRYKVFKVAGFPLWISESPEIVGMNKWDKDKYYKLTTEELTSILKENNLTQEQFTSLGFMDKFSGWLLIIVVFGAIFLYMKFSNKDTKSDEIE